MSYAENLLDADAVLQKREQSMVKGTQAIVSFLRKVRSCFGKKIVY